MQASIQAQEIGKSAAVRQYTLLSMLALVVVLLALLDRGLGEWSLAPVALGCVTLVLQLRFGPPLVLLSLIWLLAGTQGRGFDPIRVTPFRMQRRFPVEPDGLVFAEIALAAGMLIYVLGCYRLLGLVYHLFPVDPRRKRRDAPAGRHLEKRSVESVEPHELPVLVGVGFLWSVAAWAFWQWLAQQEPMWDYSYAAWRALILFWLTAVGLLLSSALLAYVGQALAGRAANAIYLQDQLWRQTRREQSRLNRWLVWARLGWQRREERS